MRVAGTRRLALILAALITAVAAVFLWPRGGPDGLLSAREVQFLLPPGSLIHSRVHLDLDGRPPQEMAVLAALPRYPQAREYVYTAYIFAYDRRARAVRPRLAFPLPEPLPLNVDAGRLLGNRDAALFAARLDDGTLVYRLVGLSGRRLGVLHEGRTPGRVVLADPFVVEDGPSRRVLRWSGRAFQEVPDMPPAVIPPSVTWRFAIRQGQVQGAPDAVFLRPRQILRLEQTGGGPTPVIIPDPNLDVLDQGYRGRLPGSYTIRLFIPNITDPGGFRLTVLVESP